MKLRITTTKVSLAIVALVFTGLFYYGFTAQIEYIPVSASLDSWIPSGYWLLLLASILSWGILVLKRPSSNLNYLTLLCMFAVVFLGIESMERYARFNDTYAYLLTSLYIQKGVLVQQSLGLAYLQNWPGFFYFVSEFRSMTGMGYQDTAKVLLMSFQLIALLLCLAVGRRVFGSKSATFLFAGATISILPWVFPDLAPQTLGALYFIVLLFALVGRPSKSTLLIFTIVFVSAVLTHGLDAYVTLFLLAAILIFHEVARRFSKLQSHSIKQLGASSSRPPLGALRVTTPLLVIVAMIFCMWSIYSTFFSNELGFFLSSIFGLGTTPATFQFGYLTPYRLPAVFSSIIYVGILACFLSFVLISNARRLPSWQPIVLAATVSVVMYFFPFTSADLFERSLSVAFIFVAWFLTFHMIKEGVGPKSRMIWISLVCLLTVAGFVAYYSHEAVEVFPQTELAGDQFYMNHALPSYILGFPSSAPRPWELAGTGTASTFPTFYQLNYADLTFYFPSSLDRSTVVIESVLSHNSVLYFTGKDFLSPYLESSRLAKTYDSGGYSIYLRW